VQVSGCVFEDGNRNGVRDPGEKSIKGVAISDGQYILLTDEEGYYEFTFEVEENRFVFLTMPTGYALATPFFYRIGQTDTDIKYIFNFGLVENPLSNREQFNFLVAADSQFSSRERYEVIKEEFKEMNRVSGEPAFCVLCGDLTMSGAFEQLELYSEMVSQLTAMPCFNLFGGHDGNSCKGVSNYELLIGPPYYSWDYGHRHFVALVSETSYLSEAAKQRQEEWLEKDLISQPEGREIYLFAHTFPPMQAFDRWLSTYNLKAMFLGHWHENAVFTYKSLPVLITNPIRGLDWGVFTKAFRFVTVGDGKCSAKLRITGQDQRLEIVSPAPISHVSRNNIPIVVNAYDTLTNVAEISGVLRTPTGEEVKLPLRSTGDWTWMGNWELPLHPSVSLPDAALVPLGEYTLRVRAQSQRGELWSSESTFTLTADSPVMPTPKTDWPTLLCSFETNRVTPDVVEPPLQLAWVAPMNGNIGTSSPVLMGGRIYIGVEDSDIGWPNAGVLALDAQTGVRIWQSKTESIRHTVAADKARIYALSVDGKIYAFDATNGEKVWVTEVYAPNARYKAAKSACMLCENRVLVFCEPGFLVCLDAQRGEELWRDKTEGSWTRQSCPIVSDGTVYISMRPITIAYELDTGQRRWTAETPIGRSASPPIVQDGVVYINGSTFHACDAQTGEVLWTTPTPTGSTFGVFCPAVDNGVVYGGGGEVVALNAFRGERIWSFQASMDDESRLVKNKRQTIGGLSSPAISGKTLYIGSDDGNLYALNAKTGEVIWKYYFGVPVKSSPIVSGNTVYVAASDGNVYAFVDVRAE